MSKASASWNGKSGTIFWPLPCLARLASRGRGPTVMANEWGQDPTDRKRFYFPKLFTSVLLHGASAHVVDRRRGAFLFSSPAPHRLFDSRGRNSDPFRWLPAFSLLIVAGCLMLRLFTLKPEEVPLATQFRIDGLFLGVTLAYLKHFRPAWFDRLSGNYSPILAAIFVAPAFLVDKLDRSMETFGLTGVSLGFFFLVAWSVARTSNNWFVMALARVGVYSYSIYLWHMVILQLFATYHHQLSFGAFWLYMACCVAGGITMAHLVEIPYLKLRDRLFPATQAALPPSALPVAAP
jgi:peptidoglycan/LPS O-acetylase OafA/YrhL